MKAHKIDLIIGEYNCFGCKSIFTDEKYVVKHIIQNMETYFCLNYDDWVKEMERVFEHGWTLLDQ